MHVSFLVRDSTTVRCIRGMCTSVAYREKIVERIEEDGSSSNLNLSESRGVRGFVNFEYKFSCVPLSGGATANDLG